ncbi:MAG: hypothetical protein FD138_2667 [Planctomycetota bacterium]|nr:MAG: hypothetical protein FD138_2667 [Planctomycetota bacterium]
MSHPQETSFLAVLADAGFPAPSVAAIRDQFHPLPNALAALLAAPKGTLDGAKLSELFDSATSDELKHSLAAVIHQTRPRGLDEWLLAAARDRRSEAARNLLAAAVAKMLPPERAVPVLLEVFHDAPLAAVHPLGKVGDERVREILTSALPTATGPLRRELRQAIARIGQRLAKASKRTRCVRS